MNFTFLFAENTSIFNVSRCYIKQTYTAILTTSLIENYMMKFLSVKFTTYTIVISWVCEAHSESINYENKSGSQYMQKITCE